MRSNTQQHNRARKYFAGTDNPRKPRDWAWNPQDHDKPYKLREAEEKLAEKRARQENKRQRKAREWAERYKREHHAATAAQPSTITTTHEEPTMTQTQTKTRKPRTTVAQLSERVDSLAHAVEKLVALQLGQQVEPPKAEPPKAEPPKAEPPKAEPEPIMRSPSGRLQLTFRDEAYKRALMEINQNRAMRGKNAIFPNSKRSNAAIVQYFKRQGEHVQISDPRTGLVLAQS